MVKTIQADCAILTETVTHIIANNTKLYEIIPSKAHTRQRKNVQQKSLERISSCCTCIHSCCEQLKSNCTEINWFKVISNNEKLNNLANNVRNKNAPACKIAEKRNNFIDCFRMGMRHNLKKTMEFLKRIFDPNELEHNALSSPSHRIAFYELRE